MKWVLSKEFTYLKQCISLVVNDWQRLSFWNQWCMCSCHSMKPSVTLQWFGSLLIIPYNFWNSSSISCAWISCTHLEPFWDVSCSACRNDSSIIHPLAEWDHLKASCIEDAHFAAAQSLLKPVENPPNIQTDVLQHWGFASQFYCSWGLGGPSLSTVDIHIRYNLLG